MGPPHLLTVFRQHPWALDATVGPRIMGPGELSWLERAVSALDGTGLSGAERMDAAVLLVGHVRGITQQARAASPAGNSGSWTAWPHSSTSAHVDAPSGVTTVVAEQAVHFVLGEELTLVVHAPHGDEPHPGRFMPQPQMSDRLPVRGLQVPERRILLVMYGATVARSAGSISQSESIASADARFSWAR